MSPPRPPPPVIQYGGQGGGGATGYTSTPPHFPANFRDGGRGVDVKDPRPAPPTPVTGATKPNDILHSRQSLGADAKCEKIRASLHSGKQYVTDRCYRMAGAQSNERPAARQGRCP